MAKKGSKKPLKSVKKLSGMKTLAARPVVNTQGGLVCDAI